MNSKALKEFAGNDIVEPKEIFQKIWSTEKILQVKEKLLQGIDTDASCFYTYDKDMRASNILFKYTKEELIEFSRCANDINYFADRYAFAMTDNGIAKINLRPYQRRILKAFQENREIILMSSRQAGKTVTSAIYIAWYVCFHWDRNALIVANKQVTAGEIVGKVRSVIQHLPFFLKPGVIGGGVGGMVFDNGCKLFSSPTSKTSGLGFTIHLLYADEFAHIPQSIVVPFYRSIYPTLSSSQISQIIITSTPNGINKFHEIYTRAEAGKNTYHHERIDWWEIPGRDEAWKAKEIANLGSLEMFEQEHGNQFLNNETSMVNSDLERLLKKTTSKYIYKNLYLEIPSITDNVAHSMKWHKNFDPKNINNTDKFAFTIDLADGGGGDYTIINIFKIEPKSKAKIKRDIMFEEEKDFFRLRQVGIFSSNKTTLPYVAEFLMHLIDNIFISENITITFETNFKGSYFLRLLENYDDIFFDGMMLYSYHSAAAKYAKPGVRMRSDNKNIFAVELRNRMSKMDIIITDENTYKQLSEFSLNAKGFFEGAGKYDDMAMSVILLIPYIFETNYTDDVSESMEHIDKDTSELIISKLFGQEEIKQDSEFLNTDETSRYKLGFNTGLTPPQEEILKDLLNRNTQKIK